MLLSYLMVRGNTGEPGNWRGQEQSDWLCFKNQDRLFCHIWQHWTYQGCDWDLRTSNGRRNRIQAVKKVNSSATLSKLRVKLEVEKSSNSLFYRKSFRVIVVNQSLTMKSVCMLWCLQFTVCVIIVLFSLLNKCG